MATYSAGVTESGDPGDDTVEAGSQLVVDLTAKLDETKSGVFELPSNDPFLPELHQVGDSVDEIANQLKPKDGVSFYPKNIMRNPSPVIKRLCLRIEEKCDKDDQSLAYLANSLSVTLNIPCKDRVPSDVICDVCLLSQRSPVFVLTVVKDDADSEKIKDYNLDITKGLVSQVRNFTDEHFSALYGVLHERDLHSFESFDLAVDYIASMSSSFCIPDSLSMTEAKFKNVLKALTTSVAVSKAMKIVKASSNLEDEAQEEEEEEDLWFLTKEQFQLLTENIDTAGLVVVWAAPRTGSTTLMVEVASRLERRGRTMLVSGSESVCQSARNHRVCSLVISRDEFMKLQADIGDMLTQVDHVVAEDVPEVLLKGSNNLKHLWLCMKVKESTSPKEKSPILKSPVYSSMTGPVREIRSAVSGRGSSPQYVETVSFRIEGEAAEPWVYDFTVVSVKNMKIIVAVDQHHHKVKSFYKVNGELKTEYMSIDKDTAGITNINNMVAVTVPKSRLIRVINVTPDLQPYSIIRTERRYHDISSLGVDKIAACAPKDGRPCVDIIDYNGNIYQSITRDEEGQNLFAHPLTIQSVSPSSVVVYDKQNRSIVCVSDRGQVIFKYCPEKKLENPCGMTVTPAGEILVADSRQQRIILLNQEGQFVKDVLTRRDNLIYPYRVWCDGAGRLYVAVFYKEVKIFEFK